MRTFSAGLKELDIHGMNVYQAKIAIDSALKRAGREVYTLRVIHGSNSGTALRDMLRRDYKNHKKVIRMELGMNPGATDLILREL